MRRMMAGIALAASACAGPAVTAHRFRNRPIVWRIDDREPLDRAPAPRGFAKLKYYTDRFFYRRVDRALDLPPPRHAANVNAIDEVPDSTWFTNRIGVRQVSVAEIRRGPNLGGGPDTSSPWIVTGTKVGGKSPGLLIRDARGDTYILKFDEKGKPELETAANVIVQRLLWACGFNVPEDDVVLFRRSQLVLADDAEIADTFGNKRPMKPEDLGHVLAVVDAVGGGVYRGMASKFLSGVPLGGLSPEGVRGDDRNDTIAHQDRRELRGQQVMFAWLDHTDIKEDNFLDMLVTDPASDGRYVVHYLVDFGKALGNLGWIERRPGDGFAYNVDLQYIVASLFGLGVWRRPWEGATAPGIRGVGQIESRRFEPYLWKPAYPWEPFARLDRHDGYWAAKIIARFTRAQLRAAVDSGKLTDPLAPDYLTRVLIERRDKLVRYWFGRVSAIDNVVSRGDALCFDDLDVVYEVVANAGSSVYRATAHDYSGAALPWRGRAFIGSGGDRTACLAGVPAGRGHDGYTIVRIVPTRGGVDRRAVEVHLASRAGKRRVIGLIRR